MKLFAHYSNGRKQEVKNWRDFAIRRNDIKSAKKFLEKFGKRMGYKAERYSLEK